MSPRCTSSYQPLLQRERESPPPPPPNGLSMSPSSDRPSISLPRVLGSPRPRPWPGSSISGKRGEGGGHLAGSAAADQNQAARRRDPRRPGGPRARGPRGSAAWTRIADHPQADASSRAAVAASSQSVRVSAACSGRASLQQLRGSFGGHDLGDQAVEIGGQPAARGFWVPRSTRAKTSTQIVSLPGCRFEVHATPRGSCRHREGRAPGRRPGELDRMRSCRGRPPAA